jgi:beta-galactosidase
MDALAKARPGQALFVSEYWPGWFDHWGHPHETRPVAPQIEDIDYILSRGAGINVYMFHGGTSFGFGAGSSYINDKFLPDVTSYDYDAPLDESGRPTAKYFAYRKELAKWSPCGNESCLPPVPASEPVITIPAISFTESTPLFDNLPKPIVSALPAPMESYGQNYGYILYRTQLPEPVHGDLVIKNVHDFANVYVNGQFAGSLDRRDAAPDGSLPPVQIDTSGRAQLDILVANDGRVNVDHTMRTETKGITQFVVLDDRPLSDWRVYLLPMTTLPAVYAKLPATEAISKETVSLPHCGFLYGDICGAAYPVDMQPTIAPPSATPHVVQTGDDKLGSAIENQLYAQMPIRMISFVVPPAPPAKPPAFYRGHFTLNAAGDTFLDTRSLGKGVVFINGHNLGRFWSVGPQQTLYVPGPWLHKGSNDIFVFDLLPQAHESVQGLDHPILDGPVSDKTTSNQE